MAIIQPPEHYTRRQRILFWPAVAVNLARWLWWLPLWLASAYIYQQISPPN